MARQDRARAGGTRSNLYDDITNKIIGELEDGRLPWVQPWGTAAAKAPLAMPRNAVTSRQYSGINVLILGVASLWLIMDFGLVEQQVAAGAPKAMEWYCGFALLVTLAWIYLEAVKLVFRIAVMMNHRK